MHRLKQLDAKIILPQIIAVFCLIFAFNSFFYLLYIDLITTYRKEGVEGLIFLAHKNDMDIVEFMSQFILLSTIVPYLGLIVGVLVSFLLTFKTHTKKINVLAIFLFCLIVSLIFLENGLSKISIKPGELFFGEGKSALIFNIIIYLALAAIFFIRNWEKSLTPSKL